MLEGANKGVIEAHCPHTRSRSCRGLVEVICPSGRNISGRSQGVEAREQGFKGDDAAINGPKFTSDAVLSCSACFTIVCLDCQRHAR